MTQAARGRETDRQIRTRRTVKSIHNEEKGGGRIKGGGRSVCRCKSSQVMPRINDMLCSLLRLGCVEVGVEVKSGERGVGFHWSVCPCSGCEIRDLNFSLEQG